MNDAATTVYLVRHGEVHNPSGIIYGRLPRFRLSPVGQEQAARAGQFLADKPVAAIYSSPMLRARQTAAAVAAARAGVILRCSALLSEVKTGWEGASGEELGKYFNFYEPQRHPGDETIAGIFARMRRIMLRLRRTFAGGQVVCVSHGDPIVIARTGFAGLPLTFANLRGPEYPQCGSLTIFIFEGDELTIGYLEPGHSPPPSLPSSASPGLCPALPSVGA